MLKRALSASILVFITLTVTILVIHNLKGVLFFRVPWLMAGAFILGITSGISRGLRHNVDVRESNCQSDRHNIDSFLEHWGTAVGVFILIVSGFLIKADYTRLFSMNLHFIGLIVTLYFSTYFLAHFFVSKKYRNLLPNISDVINGTIKKYLLRTAWRDTGKYLSSQKSAFLLFSLLGVGILVTGAIKVVAFYFSVPVQLTQVATRIHDVFAGLVMLMSLVHILFAVITRSHRRLLKSFFTGKY